MVDSQYHVQRNPLIFDQDRSSCKGQPGYLQAMLNGLKFVEQSKGISLTTESIVTLHLIATKDVHFTRLSGSGWTVGLSPFTPLLRDKNIFIPGFGFDLFNNTYTPEGLDEISTQFPHLVRVVQEHTESRPYRVYVLLKDKNDILIAMNKVIEEYYRSSRTNLDIARFAHKMNLIHPFDDGNIRVIVFLLVNKLLLDEGRPAIIFHDPNIFDGFSIHQLSLFIDEEIKLSGSFCDRDDPFKLSRLNENTAQVAYGL